MKPSLSLLSRETLTQIVAEAGTVLAELGVTVEESETRRRLEHAGAAVDRDRGVVRLPADLVERALESAPGSFGLFDVSGAQRCELGRGRVVFAPASSALNYLDYQSGEVRKPVTDDYVAFAKVASGLPEIELQSTAMVAADVDESISDSYRLFLSLLTCGKPVVTGAFSSDGFAVMHDLMLAVRGDQHNLQEKPLALFTCCPTTPLRWTEDGARNLVDCASNAIPIEVVPVPLSGFLAPVTLVGTLIQHTAEVLSGLVIAQVIRPGTPVLFGGCSAIFDIRYETSPMGAVESMMLACGANEVGRHLGLPTQAFVAMSDAKTLDAQAGLETSMGATLAALSGIDVIAGPGMLDFINCFSLEKLVLDHEICAMARRLLDGIEPCEDFPAVPLLEELITEKHLLIADHTRRHLRQQITFPGRTIDRTNRSRWREEGCPTLHERAAGEVKRLITDAEPSGLPDSAADDLEERMLHAARQAGMSKLPERRR